MESSEIHFGMHQMKLNMAIRFRADSHDAAVFGYEDAFSNAVFIGIVGHFNTKFLSNLRLRSYWMQ
jgi:hypothetical protein